MHQPFDLITESAALALAEAADEFATADVPETDDVSDLPAFLFA